MIDRHEYLNRLNTWRDQQLIKVITGVRRSGKSTLLDQFSQSLAADGVPISHIIRLNLEDYVPSQQIDSRWLFQYLTTQIKPGTKNYILLDEIQLATDWQKAINALFRRPDTDIYLTGSNAYILSGELATFLTGRYITLPMYPLSFREYTRAFPDLHDRLQLYGRYIRQGGMPYTINLQDDEQAHAYLDDVYSSILLKDVIKRYNFRDINALSKVALFLMDNIGNLFSLNNIQKSLKAEGYNLSIHTLDSYLHALEECYLIYRAERFDIEGKAILQTGCKYYAVDLGLRYHLSSQQLHATGRILENLVYLELRRRGWQVYVGKNNDNTEVDFVAVRGGQKQYFQVTDHLENPETLRRELHSLQNITDTYPKTIITLDPIPDKANDDGITARYALDWFLDDPAVC